MRQRWFAGDRIRKGMWTLIVAVLGSTLVALAHDPTGWLGAASAAPLLERFYHPPGAEGDCVSCHPAAAPRTGASPGSPLRQQSVQTFSLPPEAGWAHWWFGCDHCHSLHGGTTNLHLVSEVIDTDDLPPEYAVKTGLREVVFRNYEGLNSYADGDGVYNGVCEVCHTQTRYHRGDPSGDHGHFPGVRCTNCHDHGSYFQPVGVANHPQATTDCANCHRSPAGEPDLLGVHAYRCQACHPSGFGGTILGPIGTWQRQCAECHNPSVPQTGNAQTPTKGHRCVVCHGQQLPTTDRGEMHQEHIDKANCVVCHGTIPVVGTAIGSGNRAICAVCHEPGRYDGVAHREFHEKHVPKGASCLECHGGERPPVDVVTGPPVGTTTNVCQVCHDNQSPSAFTSRMASLHRRHTSELIDCGACHQLAILQDDRNPMPAQDDAVRASLARAGYGECRHCHGSDKTGSARSVHTRHVAGQGQWCYTCHEGTDDRPRGLQPPVTRPAESCRLCHRDRQYSAATPFDVHEEHADRAVKCYACHQLTPPLSGWSPAWLGSASSAATARSASMATDGRR